MPSLRPSNARHFRVNVGKERHFYNVYVFPTKKAMHDWCRSIVHMFQKRPIDINFGALTHPWTVQTKDGKFTKDIGFIAFCRPYLWHHVIAHECGHAALEWYFRENSPEDLDDKPGKKQEMFAWELGEMVKQILEKTKDIKKKK